MTSRLTMLAERREELVARSAAQRDELRTHAERIRDEVSWVGTLLRAARALRRSGPVIAAVVGILFVAGPARVLAFLPRALRFAPVALDAYRVVRGGGESSRESSRP